MYKLLWAFVIYVIVMGIIVYAKPASMYDENTKKYKSFGTQSKNTLFPLWLSAIVVAMVSYVVSNTFFSQTGKINYLNTSVPTTHYTTSSSSSFSDPHTSRTTSRSVNQTNASTSHLKSTNVLRPTHHPLHSSYSSPNMNIAHHQTFQPTPPVLHNQQSIPIYSMPAQIPVQDYPIQTYEEPMMPTYQAPPEQMEPFVCRAQPINSCHIENSRVWRDAMD